MKRANRVLLVLLVIACLLTPALGIRHEIGPKCSASNPEALRQELGP